MRRLRHQVETARRFASVNEHFSVAAERVTVLAVRESATHEAPVPLRDSFDISHPRRGRLVASLSAALDSPHALVEPVTVLVVTPEGASDAITLQSAAVNAASPAPVRPVGACEAWRERGDACACSPQP